MLTSISSGSNINDAFAVARFAYNIESLWHLLLAFAIDTTHIWIRPKVSSAIAVPAVRIDCFLDDSSAIALRTNDIVPAGHSSFREYHWIVTVAKIFRPSSSLFFNFNSNWKTKPLVE